MSFYRFHRLSLRGLLAVIAAAIIAPIFADGGKRLSPDVQRRYDYYFLEAMCQQNKGNYAAAFDLLRYCAELNPAAAEAYYFQAMYYSSLKQDSLALAYLEKAVELRPDNMTYLEQVAQYYYNTEATDKAIAAYEAIASKNRSRTDVQNILLSLYQKQRDYDRMLDCINRIEQIEGNSEEITLSKVSVYELKEDKKSALKALKQLADEHPSDLNYQVMMGNWLIQNGKKKEAYKIFAQAIKEEPENTYVQSSLYDYYNAVGEDSLAQDYLEKILVNPKTEEKTKVSMMRQVIQNNEAKGGDSTLVVGLFKRIMAKNPNDTTMAQLKVAYLDLKKFPEADVYDALQKVLELSPDNVAARSEMLQMLLREQRWAEIIPLSEAATQYNPDEIAFYYFLGLAYYQTKDNDAALNTLTRGLKVVTDKTKPELVADFYSIMGSIYYEKKQKKDAFAAFDSCLRWTPDNIECLNNYAYYLSVENEQLAKAAEMSYKTIKEEPKNATYLDTYAWILFRQERYTEAKIYIDQALANDTDSIAPSGEPVPSAVLLEHAGDIYICIGEVDKAVGFWQRAQQGGADSPLLPEKIKAKRYLEDEKNSK